MAILIQDLTAQLEAATRSLEEAKCAALEKTREAEGLKYNLDLEQEFMELGNVSENLTPRILLPCITRYSLRVTAMSDCHTEFRASSSRNNWRVL